MTKSDPPAFKNVAEALLYYRKQGHSLEKAIELTHKHSDLVKKWADKMEKMSFEKD